MKKLLFSILFLFSFNLFAADWDLFPYGQKSYFSYPHSSNKTGVELYVMDSVVTNGPTVDQYFRKKIPDVNIGQCNIDSLRNSFWIFAQHEIS